MPEMDVAAVADELESRLHAASTPGRAEGERRYLKSRLRHLGTSVPEIRKAAKTTFRRHPEITADEVVSLAATLWQEPVHERRMAAVELLRLGTDHLSSADSPFMERLLRESRTWALVDPLAVNVVGELCDREPDAWDATLRRWASDRDPWLRRASLLAHLPALRRGGGDFRRFGEFADAMLEEREFFVRKAIGWVLRETGKQRAELVSDWLLPRADRAAGLTVREAVKYLPAPARERILAVRQGR